MRRRDLIVSLSGLGLAACTAQGEKYERPAAVAGTGTIFVYRPIGEIASRGEAPLVEIAGKDMGRIYAGAYVAYQVPPGEYDVTVIQSLAFLPVWPKTVSVAVVTGSSAYVKVDQRITTFGGADGGVSARQEVFIEEVDEIEGQKAVKKTRKSV